MILVNSQHYSKTEPYFKGGIALIKRGCKVFGALMMLVCLIFVSSEDAHMTGSSIQLKEDKGIEIKPAFMTMEKHNDFLKSTNQLVNKIEIPTYEPNSCYEIVEIPDPSLKRLLSYTLYDNEWNDICKIDLQSLWDLDFTILPFLPDKQIEDLSGLEYAINLRKLFIISSEIKDFTPISQLQYLRELVIMDQLPHDYSSEEDLYRVIGDIKSLERLWITSPYINNNEFLSNLTNLKSLSINTYYSYGISNWDIISNLVNLETLDLSSNNIHDISFVQSLTELKQLNLDSNQVADLKPLQDLFNLESLSIDNNQVADLKPLQDLFNLGSLSICDNQVVDITSLQNLTNLGSLYLDNNQLENIDTFGSMQHLYLLSL